MPIKLLGLFSSALSLPKSALSSTISIMFHVRSTGFKCFPVIYMKSVPGFPNPSTTLTLPCSLLQVNQQSQRASLEADIGGGHCVLPPHVRPG